MAYDTRNLSVLAYANGFTLWHYRTDDMAIPEDYFADAADMLRAGDMILCNAGPGSGVFVVADVAPLSTKRLA